MFRIVKSQGGGYFAVFANAQDADQYEWLFGNCMRFNYYRRYQNAYLLSRWLTLNGKEVINEGFMPGCHVFR